MSAQAEDSPEAEKVMLVIANVFVKMAKLVSIVQSFAECTPHVAKFEFSMRRQFNELSFSLPLLVLEEPQKTSKQQAARETKEAAACATPSFPVEFDGPRLKAFQKRIA